MDQLPILSGSLNWETNVQPFQINGEDVTPLLNMFRYDNQNKASVTYELGSNYITLSGSIGVPDDIDDGEVTVTITMDDGEAVSDANTLGSSNRGPNSFEMMVQGVDEMTITIDVGDELSSVILWDFIVTEKK
ncbi:NPCBM/NEW2 domain-containing protein [Paenalkalicoccus suaedae]|uniref:NPCBM/NEW2 domain-containing protein n=1 Tax=Paenalkalicoccus suaedae TaxID=2592382 RepID=A0A859FAV1_9BACI|nr:NPCBM/NEW2 domain-containing protein [Paenalkalicoccus suaedae]QKS70473.1 NPCBM/NEW2 domain-containing protein [Paenalkalicoccus suaedae]